MGVESARSTVGPEATTSEPVEKNAVEGLDEPGAWVSPDVLAARSGNHAEFGKDLGIDDNKE